MYFPVHFDSSKILDELVKPQLIRYFDESKCICAQTGTCARIRTHYFHVKFTKKIEKESWRETNELTLEITINENMMK